MVLHESWVSWSTHQLSEAQGVGCLLPSKTRQKNVSSRDCMSCHAHDHCLRSERVRDTSFAVVRLCWAHCTPCLSTTRYRPRQVPPRSDCGCSAPFHRVARNQLSTDKNRCRVVTWTGCACTVSFQVCSFQVCVGRPSRRHWRRGRTGADGRSQPDWMSRRTHRDVSRSSDQSVKCPESRRKHRTHRRMLAPSRSAEDSIPWLGSMPSDIWL